MILKDVISLLQSSIKDTPHSARVVDLKDGIGEALIAFGIGINFGVVSILNATPERSKTVTKSVIPSDVRLGANGSADLDGINVCEVIVDHWGGNVT